MVIVGINFFFEHTSVSVIQDDSLVFVAEEERYNGIKGGKRYSPFSFQLPLNSLYAALDFLKITTREIDAIALSYDKWSHLLGLLSTRWSFYDDMYALRNLFHFRRILCSEYDSLQYRSNRILTSDLRKIPIIQFDHHLSHAASAYCYSGYNKSLIFVADCCGEKSCTSLYVGIKDRLTKLKSYDIPHSLGMLYTIITKHLGFDSFKDEYKVMGLASYGNDSYRGEFQKLIQYDQCGNYRIDNKNLFNLDKILGPARKYGEDITQRHKDIAKTLQSVVEEVIINILTFYQKKTGIHNLCMAGGIALNCALNGKIQEAAIFENIFVQPAASDAGTSMGAAALANFKLGGKLHVEFKNMYLGSEYSNEYIKGLLEHARLKYDYYADEELVKVIASELIKEKIVGIFRGRMEAGPRALGNRSVIASPISQHMLEKINIIKGREMFRPIAPIVKEDSFDEFFEGAKNQYMMFTCKVKREVQNIIPSVTHVDYTSRVQTVSKKSNPFIYLLLDEFEKLSGVPVLVNTSLNFRGKPIVESPQDAIGSFYTSGLDFLVIGNYLLRK